jgi:hypothetical protein
VGWKLDGVITSAARNLALTWGLITKEGSRAGFLSRDCGIGMTCMVKVKE